jgi:hypothetical protein
MNWLATKLFKTHRVLVSRGQREGTHYFRSRPEAKEFIKALFAEVDGTTAQCSFRHDRREGGIWVWAGDGFTAGCLPRIRESGLDSVLPNES